MNPTAKTLAIALSTVLAAAASTGQDPAGDGKDQGRQKLTEWPALKSAEQDRVRALIKQFRKPEPELQADARTKILEIGPGAAPILFPLVTDRADDVNEHLFATLDQIVDARHGALLARETGRKSVELRRYVMRRLCSFADPDLAPVLSKAAKDADEEIAFYASLGLLALAKGDGLDAVLAVARQKWTEHGELIATVLTPARGAAPATLVFEKIASARPTDQMAGLRLLRHLMVKDQSVLLRTYLGSADFTVKKEAINTARVLHGEQPLEKLASFQAIEMAKQWLDKL